MSDTAPNTVPPRATSRARPELLAPAGDRDCIRAAVENGADAIYFGLNVGFNARARAENMGPDDLPDIMAELHRRGVKGYVTLNTLVFAEELEAIEPLIRRIAAAGVDAVLVQDIGLARLIRGICPSLPIHASTQMTLTSAECIEAVRELGIERVVLPRELSVDEICTVRKKTDIELEAFVHGALCVAYSGQCLTSESLGGRSANRGQCAQACRLPYEVICDGQDVDLGAMKYLLSPQDLAAYALAGDLIDAGVVSFKIEGRLKTPEYVANITRHYRDAIDAATAGEPLPFGDDDVREMELSFSRGFSPGWLKGCDHKMLVPGLSSAKRGVLLGEILRTGRDRVTVRLFAPVAAGDGVVFEGDRAANEEQGGRVFQVFRNRQPVEGVVPSGVVDLAFRRGDLDESKLTIGQKIWKTDDPRLTSKLRKTFTGPDPLRRNPIDLKIRAHTGAVLTVTATTSTGLTAEVSSDEPLAEARKHPVTAEWLREQFGRLGGTPYELLDLAADISGGPMVPLSVASRLRHELVARLDAEAAAPPMRRIAAYSVLEVLRESIPAQQEPPAVRVPELRVLCRTMAQLRSMAECGVREVYVDFQDIREYREAVLAGRAEGLSVWPATPRIQKPDEMGLFRKMLKDQPDGILVRNHSGLRFFREQGIPCVADYSLNATNELTTQWLREHGAHRVTASYDLNRDQLLSMVQAVPREWLEIVLHQHMPMFHMEHCVFCAVLSPGTNKTNCGRPCDTHEVKLRDRVGQEHPLTADVGCRNTLFNAVSQSGAEAAADLLARGVRDFRIEFLNESPDEIHRTVALYRDLLAGRTDARSVWTQLKALNRVGVTRGTLEARRDPLAIL